MAKVLPTGYTPKGRQVKGKTAPGHQAVYRALPGNVDQGIQCWNPCKDLATVAKMYDSLCRELERRDFKEVKITEDPEMKNSLYEGEYDGFPLTIEIRYLLSISQENPEFFYRVSFEETTDVAKLDKAAKDFRVLMTEWCET
jgi:hypothetical protein